MTEQEAILELKQVKETWWNNEDICSDTMNIIIDQEHVNAICLAIKALEEVQQYRAIGTVEEFKALKEKNGWSIDTYNIQTGEVELIKR